MLIFCAVRFEGGQKSVMLST